jgi:hypothetical protein
MFVCLFFFIDYFKKTQIHQVTTVVNRDSFNIAVALEVGMVVRAAVGSSEGASV